MSFDKPYLKWSDHMVMYTQLAHLYDWPGALDFSQRLLQLTRSGFERFHIEPPGTILDLACGTGSIAIDLAHDGWHVTGLDTSPAMLVQARTKAEKHGCSIDNPVWSVGDMRHFELDTTVSAVICYTDSLNHLLTEADLNACFTAVHAALMPGGVFFFDVNTEHNFRTFWDGSDTDELPNCRLTFKASYDAESGQARADVLAEEHTEDGLRVTEESVTEQFFSEELIKQRLAETGFQDVEITPLTLPELDAGGAEGPLKLYWQCRRSS